LGRIGRMILRAARRDIPGIEVVAINDPVGPEQLAYLLAHDSVHGAFPGTVTAGAGWLAIDGKRIRLSGQTDPAGLAWDAVAAEVVVDCTGLFLSTARCREHIAAGARRVILSATPKDDMPLFVFGVNHDTYKGQTILSAASCTTNCLAPVAKVLNDRFGIERGLMTTVHAATRSQKTVDAPSPKEWRAGRGILGNIIPFSTGAAAAMGRIIPALEGKLTGVSFRVPTSDVSAVDLTVALSHPTDYPTICKTMNTAASGHLKGVLGYTDAATVSTDFRGCNRPSTFDATAGLQLDPTFFKLVAWYDNEYGYACNLLRLVRHVAAWKAPVISRAARMLVNHAERSTA
jgi:glyceraldehyde 3-phosphate dehydrogenase